jgi:hypothetical protein
MHPEPVSFEAFREAWLEDVTAGHPTTIQLGHRVAGKPVGDWLDGRYPSA